LTIFTKIFYYNLNYHKTHPTNKLIFVIYIYIYGKKKILYLNDCSYCHSGSVTFTKVIIKLLKNLYDNSEIISINRGSHREFT
jgi:hypothetical protein